MADQRVAFEIWAQSRYVSVERYIYPQYHLDPLPYKDQAVELAWQAWQEAVTQHRGESK